MKILQRIRVPAGFAFTLLFLLQVQIRPQWVLPGLVLSALGLALRIWSTGHLEKGRRLAVGGPYQHIRNPLYVGSLLTAAGFLVAAASIWMWLLFGLLFGCIYLPVVRREEEELRQVFAETFEAYRRSVPAFVPRGATGPLPQTGKCRFRWRLFIRNREYRAVIGFLALMTFILYRSNT